MYIGRMDYLSSGALILTNNGQLARELTLKENDVEKIY